jgi:RNAse (barnase) inhibitor barstar
MKLEDALDAPAGGVFRHRPLASGDPAVAGSEDRRVVRITAGNARDKLAFLKVAAEALQFPSYFGQNWDAFYDCLTDLALRPGERLTIAFDNLSGFARADPDEFAAAVDALRDAVEHWSGKGARLIVLIGLDGPLLATELPEISVR